jgi:glycosyltransferase involved in cell wall biosynthesis
LPELLGSGTLAVYPYRDSLITRSKQSVKLLELMAAGCPVIASDVGDVAATLGMAGLVLTGDHPAAFAAATVELLDRSERLHAMRAAGPRRVATCFTIERLADELRALYVELGLPCSS